jgi:ribose 5-phosphate isomerase A
VIQDPEKLNAELRLIPGVLDHGLFVGIATDALIGHSDGTVEHMIAET